MRFGHFDDATREYVITTPRTPYPWINYLGTEEFFGLISNTGGGYCFYRDARLRRLTRYRYNNVPTDAGGRYFYIHDGGDFWTPGWAAGQARAGLLRVPPRPGLHRITGERNGLRADVPLLRAARHERRGPPRACSTNTSTGDEEREALLLRRVLPVERLGRQDELPAQPVHRRGRGRRPRSTTRPSTASGATTTPSTRSTRRSPASTRTARASWGSTTASASRRSWPRGSRATPGPAAGRRSARTSSR